MNNNNNNNNKKKIVNFSNFHNFPIHNKIEKNKTDNNTI